MTTISFRQFLSTAFQHGDYTTDDVIASVLPLFRSVQLLHESGLVAPFDLEGALLAGDRIVRLDELLAHPPRDAYERVAALHGDGFPPFDVVGKQHLSADAVATDLQVHADTSKPLRHAAYITGYRSYEMLLGHHDEQTDIFCLGLVLAAVALGIDLESPDGPQQLAAQRKNPLSHRRLHPAIGTLIREMTELDRSRRTQDLPEAIRRLEHYRDFDPEKQTDLTEVAGWKQPDRSSRKTYILHKLRNRLFDLSRRNRLLYYKPNARFANLTFSSVPMVLHHQSIRPDLLFTWGGEIARKVTAMEDLPLQRYLRFEDHPYLDTVLNKIRLEARRDVQEFGFSQLRLVIGFLRWHNLREEPEEPIFSPLLLVPAELKKKKQVGGDQYVLSITDNNAEVNPVLANQLQELYGIRLPETVDLEEMSLERFHALLQEQIEGVNKGIVLQYNQKPRIRLIYKEAKATLEQYGHKKGQPVPATQDVELFELAEDAVNPYRWELDSCHIVLGNFNYKKMSLVQDYNATIDEPAEHAVFSHLFSDAPKPVEDEAATATLPDDWYHVVQADPTQTRAILQAREGKSYIIQGPPGTGKSQTITNLIADFVARGKQVLFVCEKRAALDVVYHRLQQQGLAELCCYIHDSQGDKRAFIKDLKQTYESFLRKDHDLHSVTLRRDALLHRMRQQLQTLEDFHAPHAEEQEEAGIGLRALMERLLALKGAAPAVDAATAELVPPYRDWLQYGNMIAQLGEALEETGAEPVFAWHPLSKVRETILAAEHPITLLEKLTGESLATLSHIRQSLRSVQVDAATLPDLQRLVRAATLLLPLAETGNLRLVDPATPEAIAFKTATDLYRALQQGVAEAERRNVHWREKFSSADTDQALAVAMRYEGSFWRFLSGNWRRLKKQMQQRYDASAHPVPPLYSAVLELLQAEHAAVRSAEAQLAQLKTQYRLDNPLMTEVAIERLRAGIGDAALQYLLRHPQAEAAVRQLAALEESQRRLERLLAETLQDAPATNIQQLEDELDSIRLNAPALEDLLPSLGNYLGMPDTLKTALRRLPWSPAEMESGMAGKTLQRYYRGHRAFAGVNGQLVQDAAREALNCYNELLQLNAAYIRAGVRERFAAAVRRSGKAISQLPEAEQEQARDYAEGRKILENEFSKSMRYKSIRELTSGGSGPVLKDLKPVWLMSPLSVSDSLAMDQPFFDAVIFDEASQITLEEGVPSLFRAPQAIIVGDERQMPPTDFFSARSGDPDDLEHDDEEDEVLSADADSLLVQGARKMSSHMLGWHYRSRYETLISFSNHAFYGAGLLTVPDRSIHHPAKSAISVTQPSDALFNATALFDRSISFHHVAGGVYLKRGNLSEATYIAHLVRELLRKKRPETIGIVAFSQEQQLAITAALEALAATDPVFETQLDEAEERTDEGQFTGLFVKNLENVQGDERDIIIMSVCYAPDHRGKMAMHFGPINKKGGEKRLNVIFSRAKQHMAVVSSIRHHQITNVYNAGANYFRQFLQYAETVSAGNAEGARRILEGLSAVRGHSEYRTPASVMLGDIRAQLEQQGFTVAEQLGQSGFRCSLAVKMNAQDESWALGIIVDDEEYFRHENVLEQYCLRPAVMERAGWKTVAVYAKDWLEQPQKVMEALLRQLGKQPEAAPLSSLIAAEAIPEGTTRLLLGEGRNEKFWEVAVSGSRLFIRQGKTGAKGQIQVKTCIDPADAEKERDNLVAGKKAEGWRDAIS
ncbi:AAA domain-containing protein [Chitinophaga lutea]